MNDLLMGAVSPKNSTATACPIVCCTAEYRSRPIRVLVGARSGSPTISTKFSVFSQIHSGATPLRIRFFPALLPNCSAEF
jgi:hypothetical protein